MYFANSKLPEYDNKASTKELSESETKDYLSVEAGKGCL